MSESEEQLRIAANKYAAAIGTLKTLRHERDLIQRSVDEAEDLVTTLENDLRRHVGSNIRRKAIFVTYRGEPSVITIVWETDKATRINLDSLVGTEDQ